MPVYVSQPVSSVVVPPQRLVGSQGDINASGPPTVEPGDYVVALDKDDTTPYDVAVSAPFTIF